MALEAGKSSWRSLACGCRAGGYLERYPQGQQVRGTAVGDLSIHSLEDTLIVNNSAIWPVSLKTFALHLILNFLSLVCSSMLGDNLSILQMVEGLPCIHSL